MLPLAVCLAFLCGFLALRVYALERDLRRGASQLRKRREEGGGAPLRLAAPNAAAEALLAQVNSLLRDTEEERGRCQRREKALREQIANVSHDLRTPLTSILGYLQLLEDDALSEGERREYLEVIRGRATVLQGLITSFYDLSRLEAGEYPLERVPVDLREVIGELLAAFYDEMERRFAVTVDLPQGLPPVLGDRSALTRIYSNLIRNALEHGADVLTISARQEGGEVVTRFANGGSTLAPEDLPRVFERFYTADRARDKGNTGLGLAIVKALAECMGGQVQVSLEGRQFVLTLRWRI